MEKIVKRIIGILFAVFILAGIVMCDRPATQTTDPDQLDTPSNIIPPKDTDGANQNKWGL